MGEIKSTLDLVLEKTKNLTLSSEEKQAQKQKEIENRIKGLLQKYQDGILTQNQLESDYETLKKEFSMSSDDVLINEITGRLEPNGDNQPLLELMQACCGIDYTAIDAIIENYRKTFLAAENHRMARVKEDFAQHYGISGSAVVPNLDADEEWRQETRGMRTGFENQLNRVRAELTPVRD